MFCRNCGKQSDGTEKFCSSCGHPFSHITYEQGGQPSYPRQKWTTGRVLKIIGSIAVVLFVIGLRFGVPVYNPLENQAVETNNNAISAYEAGKSDQAIQQFQEASHSALSTENKINTLKNLAYVYASDLKNDLALNTFHEALALTRDGSYDYYLISGEIALLERKPNAALLAFNKAYELQPNEFQINNSLALFYLDLEEIAPQYANYKRGLQFAQKAYELSPQEMAKQNLAIAYYFNEKYDQTISLLSTSDLHAHPYAAYWLGLAFLVKEDHVQAKFYLRKALAGGAIIPEEIHNYVNAD
jgi:tetratricopeptide (TPR) repeat protein